MKSNTSTPAPSRLAKNYRLVHEVVHEQGHGTHLSVAEVWKLAKQRRPGIGFTTVYRALGRLREIGLVSEIRVPGADNAYYEPSGQPHAHFRCRSCGKVDDVDYVLSQPVVDELARRAGADVSEVSLTLHGRCAHCRGLAE